jgi:molybdate-binding protein/transcriptional regulator with XRE-family HTH domain
MAKQPMNRVRERRLAQGLSQAELATLAGLSRPAVSAIEIERLVPSVAGALALARVFGCSVEELFAPADPGEPAWAWLPDHQPCRYWQARVNSRLLLYPVESLGSYTPAHDGLASGGILRDTAPANPDTTLVVASCDPAISYMADAFNRATGGRMLVLHRTSRSALELLGKGLVHAAGIHFSTASHPDGNAHKVRELLGSGYRLAHVSSWEEGICTRSTEGVATVAAAVGSKLRWVGREPGSAAGQCLAELLPDGARPRRQAPDHRGVALAVRWGWADAGVCHRYVTEDGGLDFLSVRGERYDLCFAHSLASDPRIAGLLGVLRSPSFRRLIGELPGFDTCEAGAVQNVE